MSDIALTVSVLALVAVVGLWIGSIKVRGVGFGIGGVLFGGIYRRHFVDQAAGDAERRYTALYREFGPRPFVLPSAYRWGRGFRLARVSGLRLNLFAILIVIMGGLVTAILHKIFLYSAAGGAGDFLRRSHQYACVEGRSSKSCAIWERRWIWWIRWGMSYAMAYPFGICGILLTMWLMRLIFSR
ncbi:hypothetical protein KCP71_06370 [Salmonella enterica subsp. enterica]|nr:hypothetical protein KCP71_06370 [Salmonella enterica subsp. enterica]